MGKSAQNATFKLFLGLGWPWDGQFFGFIIFTCFPTQQNLVNRKHPYIDVPVSSVLGRSCYIAERTAWPVLRCMRERSAITWSLTAAVAECEPIVSEQWVSHESEAGILIYFGVLMCWWYVKKLHRLLSHNIREIITSAKASNHVTTMMHERALVHDLVAGSCNNGGFCQQASLQNYSVSPLMYVSDKGHFRCSGTR